MIAYLIPFEAVGIFQIGKKITEYDCKFEIEKHEFNTFRSEHYSIDHPKITLFVMNDVIDSIACYEECLFKGRNLIGMNLNEFMVFTGEEYTGKPDPLEFEEDGVPQWVYEFEGLGLQVWTKNDNIVTVIVSEFIE